MTRTDTVMYAGEAVATDVILYVGEASVSDVVIPQNTTVYLLPQTVPGVTGMETYPAVDNVRAGVAYGPNASDYNGDITFPGVGDVKLGVGYGANGIEFIGTLVISLNGFIFFVPYIFHGRPRML